MSDDDMEGFDEDDLVDGFGEEVITEGDIDVAVEPDIDILEDDEGVEVDVVEVVVVEEKDADDVEEDEVELALDEILAAQVRLAPGEVSEDEDEDGVSYDSGDGDGDIPLPLQEDEFKCQDCRLLKSRSQLVDRVRMLCRDCA